MSMEIEVPVGGIIRVHGSELVCLEDYVDEYEMRISCGACPINESYVCQHLACGHAMRSDHKSVHFEYYYVVSK